MGEDTVNARVREEAGATVRARVQYFGGIRAATKIAEEDVEAPAGSAVGALLGALAQRYGAPFSSEVFEAGGGALREDLMIVRNGALAERRELLASAVQPGDLIALHPIFLGGG